MILSPSAFARQQPVAASTRALIDTADGMGLARERAWEVLFYIRDRVLLRSPSSVVDTDAFFLAGRDDWNPQAEMRATITAMLHTGVDPKLPDAHPVCRFPARREWLKERLPGFAAAVPTVTCPQFDRWSKPLDVEKVSLVFSSYFANNPASTFGHSFLRLHRRPVPGQISSEMLDETINFMAYPWTDNPVLYPVMGLLGRFPGQFSMAPFYIKIQEYNNAESRDLWSYELSFDQQDIGRLKNVLWEMGQIQINYFYFDENCSFILLTVLEAAKPELHLPPPHPWVIPSDTLRTIMNSPGLVADISYRPSALTRFLHTYRHLTDDEQDAVDAIVAANDAGHAVTFLRLLAVPSQARVIDAVIEFIDFDEKLAGSKEAAEHAALRQRLLALRSSMRVEKMNVPIPVPELEQPHLIGGTTRVGTGVGYAKDQGAILQAVWRPALHDLASPDLGYSNGLAITFFDTTLRYLPKTEQAFLHKYNLLTILSVPDLEWITRPFAWNFEVGAENLGACTDIRISCYSEHLRGGLGPIIHVGPGRVYGMARAEVGASGLEGFKTFAGIDATAGGQWPVSPWTKYSFQLTGGRRFGQNQATADVVRGQLDATHLLTNRLEITATVARLPEGRAEFMGSLYYYY